jgi:hypothetical protein
MDKLMLEFHDSKIQDITVGSSCLSIDLDTVVCVLDQNNKLIESEDHRVPVKIEIHDPKFNKIPDQGVLWDGKLEIPGKPSDYFPMQLDFMGEFILTLSKESGDFEIKGNRIQVQIDRSKIPAHLMNLHSLW